MDKALQNSFKNALNRLISLYLLGLLATAVLLTYFDRLQHVRLGNTLALAIHNSIVIRDLRTAVSILNHSVPENFSGITLYAANGDRIFALPPLQEVRESADWLESHLSVPLQSSITGEAALGQVQFSYLWYPPIVWSASLGLIMLLCLWPIYHRMKLQVELRHEELLRQGEAELTAEIARKVAHDIRSPLSALNMITGQLSGASSDHKKLIQAASSRINSIANDLLARAHTGVLMPVSTSSHQMNINSSSLCALSDILREIHAEKCAQFANCPNLNLKLDISLTASADRLLVDAKELSQALSNLINNAIEGCDGHGQVTIALRPGHQTFVICISDTGKGMPSEVLESLGNRPISWGKKQGVELCSGGTGQGVYFAKKAIEKMGGSLKFQSRVGHGTIASIEFPIHTNG